MFLCYGKFLDTGLVIPVEVVRNEIEAKGSREAASLPSMLLRSLYKPLKGMHDNRGFRGLVHENEEGMAKVSFLSLGGLCLLNLGEIILFRLVRTILLNTILVGLSRLLGSG